MSWADEVARRAQRLAQLDGGGSLDAAIDEQQLTPQQRQRLRDRVAFSLWGDTAALIEAPRDGSVEPSEQTRC